MIFKIKRLLNYNAPRVYHIYNNKHMNTYVIGDSNSIYEIKKSNGGEYNFCV